MKKSKIILISIFLISIFLILYISLNKSNQEISKDKISIVDDNEYIKIVSWNIQHFGKSKDIDELNYITSKLKDQDIIAIQEVSTSIYGSRAVAQLDDNLDRTGSKWDYVISDPTSGKGSEKYAYLWKTSKVKLINKSLSKELSNKIDREPFIVEFNINEKKLILANFHAVPTNKNPKKEISILHKMDIFKNSNVIIMGDFNLSSKDKSFNTMYQNGYNSVLSNQKTSLKMKPKNNKVLNKEYDNFIYRLNDFNLSSDYGILPFYKDFQTLKEARKISDHCPIYMKIK